MSRKMLWVDVEATGLNPPRDLLLEVGLRITTWDGTELDRVTSLVWNNDWLENLARNPNVWAMHKESGLIDDLEALWPRGTTSVGERWVGHAVPNVEERLVQWVTNRLSQTELATMPMTGNSVHYDRKFLAHYMPEVEQLWHYRNNDISSTREQCRLINPALFAKIPQQPKAHRPQADIDASIFLWRWLIDNFLWEEPIQEGE